MPKIMFRPAPTPPPFVPPTPPTPSVITIKMNPIPWRMDGETTLFFEGNRIPQGDHIGILQIYADESEPEIVYQIPSADFQFNKIFYYEFPSDYYQDSEFQLFGSMDGNIVETIPAVIVPFV